MVVRKELSWMEGTTPDNYLQLNNRQPLLLPLQKHLSLPQSEDLCGSMINSGTNG
jgi:hypothetical protein